MVDIENRDARICGSFRDADHAMIGMTPKEKWRYLVAAQDHFWACLSHVENESDVEIDSTKSLDDYVDANDYKECQDA